MWYADTIGWDKTGNPVSFHFSGPCIFTSYFFNSVTNDLSIASKVSKKKKWKSRCREVGMFLQKSILTHPGGRFGAALPTQPIHRKNGPNRLNWQCCLAGSSKTAPTILIFSIAMGADYSLELISIVHCVPQFFVHNTVRPWDARFLGNEKTCAAQIRATFVT